MTNLAGAMYQVPVSDPEVSLGHSRVAALRSSGLADLGAARERREAFIDTLLDRAIQKNAELHSNVKAARKLGTTQELSAWAALTNLPPVSAPNLALTDNFQDGATSFAANLGQLFSTHTPGAGPRLLEKDKFDRMHADQLLAAFLKLQITDPNNSVETHNDLHQSLSNLRQMAIEEARKRMERAAEAKKEAEAYASMVQTVSCFLSVFTFALSFATGGFSLLSSVVAAPAQASAQAAAQAAQRAAMEAAQLISKEATQQAVQVAEMAAQKAAKGAMEAAKKAVDEAVKAGSKAAQEAAKQAAQSAKDGMQNIANRSFEQAAKSFEAMAQQSTKAAEAVRPASAAGQNLSKTMEFLTQGATEILNGAANANAAQKAAEAQQLALLAQRMKLFADLLQQQIQEEAEIINQIMESKNRTVSAVTRMLEEQHGVALKVMAAGMVQ